MRDQQTQRKTPAGIMLLRPEARDYYALFQAAKRGCEMRIYPAVGADGQPLPLRLGPAPRDVTHWLNDDHRGIRYKGGGDPSKERITLLLTIRGDENIKYPDHRRGVRVWNKIRNTLYHRLKQGQAPPTWASWAEDSFNAVIGPPRRSASVPFAFVRGMITEYNTATGPLESISRSKPELRAIIDLSPAAYASLRALVLARTPGTENYHGENWDQLFRWNKQLIDPQTGCLLRVGAPSRTASGQIVFNRERLSESYGLDGAADDRFKIPITFVNEPRIPGAPPEPRCVPIPLEIIQDAWQHSWEEALQTYADETELLAALEVGLPDQLLIEAYRDDPQVLPESLREKKRRLETGPIHYSVPGGSADRTPSVGARVLPGVPGFPQEGPSAGVYVPPGVLGFPQGGLSTGIPVSPALPPLVSVPHAPAVSSPAAPSPGFPAPAANVPAPAANVPPPVGIPPAPAGPPPAPASVSEEIAGFDEMLAALNQAQRAAREGTESP